jgi:DNA-directed RNA polymerase subunit RPC12/RpoP
MIIHKCLKCKKTFESPSKLNRHLNNKTPCDAPKKDYKCITCNVKFISPA